MTRAATGVHDNLPESFEDLCVRVRFPRPIKDRADYENVVEIIDLLTSVAELAAGQEEYLDALSTFVEAYEAREFPIEKEAEPSEVLKFLLESNGMSPADLSKLLGDDSRSLGTRLLSGERQLSKAHITILCRHFGVSADLLL